MNLLSPTAALHRFVTVAVGATAIGSSLFLMPAPASSTAVHKAEAILPDTGSSMTARIKVWHEPEPRVTGESIYARYIPPPPPPAPLALPAPPAAPWVAPPGYVTIPVPVYRQTMNLDCETAALQMGLATFGHYYSQSALFSLENPDLRAPVMGPNHVVLQWGDPYTNFVGNVNGNDWTPTGYGIYYPPIVAIARTHGLPNASGGEGFAPSTIYAALLAGHPVEVWVETGWARPYLGTWAAWDGGRIRYSLIEHAVTLSGISPSSVRVNDPLYGTQYWISKGLFETVWADFNNMAVIFQ